MEYSMRCPDTFMPVVASWNDSSNTKGRSFGRASAATSNGSLGQKKKKKEICCRQGTIRQEGTCEDTIMRCGRSARWANRPNCSSLSPICIPLHQISERRECLRRPSSGERELEKVVVRCAASHANTLNAYDFGAGVAPTAKNQVFIQASKPRASASGIGTPGEKAATQSPTSWFRHVFANYCTGAKDAQELRSANSRAVEAHPIAERAIGRLLADCSPPESTTMPDLLSASWIKRHR